MNISTTTIMVLVSLLVLNIHASITGQSNQVPQFSHIVIVIGENTNADAVYGSSNAPYINSLADNGAKFINSHGLFHPSQPDYLALFSGSNQGVVNDGPISTPFTTPNLGRELIDALKTYATYSEGLPSVGYNGNASSRYVRKHNPAANWMGTNINQIPISTNQPFTAFPVDYDSLPSVALVIPDICNDGHDACAPLYNKVKQYDIWIETHLNAYKQWCKEHNSLLIVTYDEDNFTSLNKIATVFYGAHVVTGVYDQSINHYNVLRTIEDAEALATHAGASATANPIDYCWETVTGVISGNDAPAEITISAYPNPFTSMLNISVELQKSAEVQLELYNLLGQQIFESNNVQEAGTSTFQITGTDLPIASGMLLLKVQVNGKPTSVLLTRVGE